MQHCVIGSASRNERLAAESASVNVLSKLDSYGASSNPFQNIMSALVTVNVIGRAEI